MIPHADATTLEAIAIAVALGIAWTAPRASRIAARALYRAGDWLGRGAWRAPLVCGAAAALGSAAVALFVQWPIPRVHDEFSYLLAADTFAHGRLTNPTPPAWEHFETFHVLFTPSYASKYPPAQGLLLALGQAAFGTAVPSLWLGAFASCASIAWMLRAWLAPRWAALGGLIAVVQLGIGSYWTQSFWGGAVSATGGALVFGALPRIVRDHRPRDAWILGLGLALLANSRPFEGLVAALPVAVALFVTLARAESAQRRRLGLRTLAPLAATLGACALWIAIYDRAVTGDPLVMPYWVHDRLYTLAPPFLWIPLAAEPVYRHAWMREYWTGFALDEYTNKLAPGRFVSELLAKYAVFWRFYSGWLWAPAFACVPFALRTPWLRFAALVVIVFLVVSIGSTYTLAHYAAPIAPLVVVLLVAALRWMSAQRARGRAVGRAVVVALCAASLASLTFQVRHRRRPDDAWDVVRAQMQATLSRSIEQDLVIVRYGPRHSPHDEWVFNAADIDSAPVVWARDMGDAANARLVAQMPQRAAWILDVDRDATPPALAPYAGRARDARDP